MSFFSSLIISGQSFSQYYIENNQWTYNGSLFNSIYSKYCYNLLLYFLHFNNHGFWKGYQGFRIPDHIYQTNQIRNFENAKNFAHMPNIWN